MDTFWPEADPEAARRNLHQAIYALRQTLKIDSLDFQHIQFENDRYRFNPALNIWLDDEEFERHVAIGQKYEQSHALDKAMAEYGIAEGLYQGDFLAEDLYEDWTQARRQNLWQTYLSVAYRLTQYYLDRGEYAATIALSQHILAMDNCQEEAHQTLMNCYLAYGQRHLALRQYQLCVQVLKTELELAPSAETQAIYHQIVEGQGYYVISKKKLLLLSKK
jgi:DNA-binding SARP family transcriptional activator